MDNFSVSLIFTLAIIGLVAIPSEGLVPKLGKIAKSWYKVSILIQMSLVVILIIGAFEFWETYKIFPSEENQIIAMFVVISAILIAPGYLFLMIPKTLQHMKKSQ